MNVFYSTFPTEFGVFSVAVDEVGAVVATSFGEFDHTVGRPLADAVQDERATAAARAQLQAYFAGKRRDFDLPLSPEGTEFQRRVWDALGRIPFGKTISYGELAREVGNPKASRAVGSANGANPICVIIPCHRVIAGDGSIGGFGFGVETKRRLLALEGI